MVNLRSRTALFVPAEARKLEKARRFLADELVFDLEDGVDASEITVAREALVTALSQEDWRAGRLSVRINQGDSEELEADLAALQGIAHRLHSLWVPKVESVPVLGGIRKLVRETTGPLPLTVLLESAAGLLNARPLAEQDNVRALALGTLDLSADIEVPELSAGGAPELLSHLRASLTLAARASGREAIDGPWLSLEDLSGLRADATAARLAAMTGKICIHPKQVEACTDVFRIDQQQLDRARQVLDQSSAAGRLEDRMIDAATHRLAAGVVERAAVEGVRGSR